MARDRGRGAQAGFRPARIRRRPARAPGAHPSDAAWRQAYRGDAGRGRVRVTSGFGRQPAYFVSCRRRFLPCARRRPGAPGAAAGPFRGVRSRHAHPGPLRAVAHRRPRPAGRDLRGPGDGPARGRRLHPRAGVHADPGNGGPVAPGPHLRPARRPPAALRFGPRGGGRLGTAGGGRSTRSSGRTADRGPRPAACSRIAARSAASSARRGWRDWRARRRGSAWSPWSR